VNAVAATAIIVAIFFAVGVIVGVISVIAMAAIRTNRKPELPGSEPPAPGSDDRPSWPDYTNGHL
jgi:hypothetical protein